MILPYSARTCTFGRGTITPRGQNWSLVDIKSWCKILDITAIYGPLKVYGKYTEVQRMVMFKCHWQE